MESEDRFPIFKFLLVIGLLWLTAVFALAAHCPPAKPAQTPEPPIMLTPEEQEAAEVFATLRRFPSPLVACTNAGVALDHWKHILAQAPSNTDKDWWFLYLAEAEKRYDVWVALTIAWDQPNLSNLENLKEWIGEHRFILGAMPAPMPFIDEGWE